MSSMLTGSATIVDTAALQRMAMSAMAVSKHNGHHADPSEGEQRFRAMINLLPAAIYTTDAQGRITHFNPACVEFSGRTPEIGSDQWCVTWKLYHPDGRRMPHDECPMAIALKEGRTVRGAEAIAERPDGTRIWFTPYPTPLFDDAGNVIGGINMLVDITERKTAEEKLRFSEKRYHQLLEMLPVAVYTCEAPSGRITYFNESAARLWGRRPDLNDTSQRFCGSYKLYSPDGIFVPHDQCPMASTLREGTSFRNMNVVIERTDGTRISAMVNIDPVRDSHGHVVGAVNAFIDVTAIKQAEAALRHNERELADFFDNAPVGLHWVGRDGTILRANQAELDLLGYSREEYIGRHIAEFHADQHVIDDILFRLSNHETLQGHEARLRCKDGSIKHVLIDSNVQWEGDPPQFIHTRCFTRDITRRKQSETVKSRLAAIIESSDDAIISKDLSGIISS